MSLVNYAKAELRAAGMFDADADYNGEIAPRVVALMETLAAYGHSEGSLAHTLVVINRLAAFKPLSPLTGADDEWIEVASEDNHPLFQNKRCSTVFKKNGVAWDIEGDPKHAPIQFPYTVA